MSNVCEALCEAPWALSKWTQLHREVIYDLENVLYPGNWRCIGNQSKQKSSEFSYKQQKPWSLLFPGAFILLISICHCFPACQAQSRWTSDYSKSSVDSERWEHVPILPVHAHLHSEEITPSLCSTLVWMGLKSAPCSRPAPCPHMSLGEFCHFWEDLLLPMVQPRPLPPLPSIRPAFLDIWRTPHRHLLERVSAQPTFMGLAHIHMPSAPEKTWQAWAEVNGTQTNHANISQPGRAHRKWT